MNKAIGALLLLILAAIAVPQYLKVAERRQFARGAKWLEEIAQAQERYVLKHKTYDGTLSGFDPMPVLPPAFKARATTVGAVSWKVTLERQQPCPTLYGCYTVTYTAPPGSMVCSSVDCSSDLLLR